MDPLKSLEKKLDDAKTAYDEIKFKRSHKFKSEKLRLRDIRDQAQKELNLAKAQVGQLGATAQPAVLNTVPVPNASTPNALVQGAVVQLAPAPIAPVCGAEAQVGPAQRLSASGSLVQVQGGSTPTAPVHEAPVQLAPARAPAAIAGPVHLQDASAPTTPVQAASAAGHASLSQVAVPGRLAQTTAKGASARILRFQSPSLEPATPQALNHQDTATSGSPLEQTCRASKNTEQNDSGNGHIPHSPQLAQNNRENAGDLNSTSAGLNSGTAATYCTVHMATTDDVLLRSPSRQDQVDEHITMNINKGRSMIKLDATSRVQGGEDDNGTSWQGASTQAFPSGKESNENNTPINDAQVYRLQDRDVLHGEARKQFFETATCASTASSEAQTSMATLPAKPIVGGMDTTTQEVRINIESNRARFSPNNQSATGEGVSHTTSGPKAYALSAGRQSFGFPTSSTPPLSSPEESLEGTNGPAMRTLFSSILPMDIVHGLHSPQCELSTMDARFEHYPSQSSIMEAPPSAPLTRNQEMQLRNDAISSASIPANLETDLQLTSQDDGTPFFRQSVQTSHPTGWNTSPMTNFEDAFNQFEMNMGGLLTVPGSASEHSDDRNTTSDPKHPSENFAFDLQLRTRSSTSFTPVDYRSYNLHTFESGTQNDTGSMASISPDHDYKSPSLPFNLEVVLRPEAPSDALDASIDANRDLPDTPRLKEARNHVNDLKEIISNLQSTLATKNNEMHEFGVKYLDKILDLDTLIDRTSPIKKSIAEIQSNIDSLSSDLAEAEEKFIVLRQHMQDLARRSGLEAELTIVLDKLKFAGLIPYGTYNQLGEKRRDIETELAEIEQRLKRAPPGLDEGRSTVDPDGRSTADSESKKRKASKESKLHASKKQKVHVKEGKKPKRHTITESEQSDTDDNDESSDDEPPPPKKGKSTHKGCNAKEEPGEDELETEADEPPAPKRGKSTRKGHDTKEEPEEENDEFGPEVDNPHYEGRMPASRFRRLIWKVKAKEDQLKNRKKNSSNAMGKGKKKVISAEDLPFDDSPIPGLTASEFAELEVEGLAQIGDFLRTGKIGSIHASIRRLTRIIHGFLPVASMQTRKLALAIHYTEAKNYQCRYHAVNRYKKDWDGAGKYIVEGVGYRPDLQAAESPKGHMHCGCPVDDVLLEFYFWKCWTAHSTNPRMEDKEEGMKDILISPRLRAFICQAFRGDTLLGVDDIYHWASLSTSKPLSAFMGLLQVQRHVEALQEQGYDIQVSRKQNSSAQGSKNGRASKAREAGGGQEHGDARGQN